ncbi:MAG: 23S rRNA (guanosine(2251)-2'-O)-methyltransferase RlmB [Desulfobacteraceae bacterium]|nr:23S rRNA (guanosine(2251)-2'-O)-methyltransferase RlmB [Desulfobacteraceae bacterium]
MTIPPGKKHPPPSARRGKDGGRPAASTSPRPPQARPAPDERIDLIWGLHPVTELVANRPQTVRELRFLKSGSPKLAELRRQAERAGIPCHLAEQPFPCTPEQAVLQGVQARIKPVATVTLDQLLAMSDEDGPALILALDCIQDPHNLGAMIRSAAAAGARGLIYTKDRSAPLSGAVAKVSAGAIAHLPLCPVTNLTQALQRLQEGGFWVFGADPRAETSIHDRDFSGPVCLVIGGEGGGIRPLVRRQCDFLVSIPMHTSLDSLNASVAAAVIMFEIVRQRRRQPTPPPLPG